MLTTLLTQVHQNLATLPSAVVTILLLTVSFVLFFIALLPAQHILFKSLVLAWAVFP